MPNRSNLAETSHILEVINDVFARHRDGTLSDFASRQTLSAFVKSYPAGDLLSPGDAADFDAYLDLSLQISQRATSSYDAETAACARIVMGIAVGQAAALGTARRAVTAGAMGQMPMACP